MAYIQNSCWLCSRQDNRSNLSPNKDAKYGSNDDYKNLERAIRKEKKRREAGATLSPVWQHMGVYGYRTDILRRFVGLPQGHYETLEGLEQLRFLENGISIQTVEVSTDKSPLQAGIDSPEDLARAEAMIRQFGDDI